MEHKIIAFIYLIITLLFSANLKDLYRKYKNKQIPISSIMATLSLVVSFFLLSLFFIFDNHLWIVFVSQTYLLSFMLYLKFFGRKG